LGRFKPGWKPGVLGFCRAGWLRAALQTPGVGGTRCKRAPAGCKCAPAGGLGSPASSRCSMEFSNGTYFEFSLFHKGLLDIS